MIDEKSENRVLAAIEGLKADMTDFRTEIKAEIAELCSDIKALTKDVSDVKAGLASVKPHLIVVYGLLVSGIDMLTWLLSVFFEPVR